MRGISLIRQYKKMVPLLKKSRNILGNYRVLLVGTGKRKIVIFQRIERKYGGGFASFSLLDQVAINDF